MRHEGWHSRLVSIVESFARWKITPQGYTRGKKGQKGLKIRPPANTQGRNGNFLLMKKPFFKKEPNDFGISDENAELYSESSYVEFFFINMT